MARVRPLLLLLLLGTLDSGMVQENGCNEGSQSVKEADISKIDGEPIYEGYLKVKEDFRGIRLKIQGTNNAAWFSRDSCFPNNDEWTQIMAKMNMRGNKITVTLRTGHCWETCTISSTLPGNFIIVHKGSIYWQKKPPNCENLINLLAIQSSKDENTCEKLPPETTTYTSDKTRDEGKLELWVIVTVAVSIVAVVSAVVCWKCMTSRNATNPPNSLSRLDNSPRVIENDDMYETLDSSAIKNRSCEAIHWSSKNGLSPGQGEETYSTENELYESFSSYGHK